MSYLAIFIQEKDGRFSVSVPALPGCFSQGASLKEAKKNIGEAIELYLEDEDFGEEVGEEMQIVASINIPLKR